MRATVRSPACLFGSVLSGVARIAVVITTAIRTTPTVNACGSCKTGCRCVAAGDVGGRPRHESRITGELPCQLDDAVEIAIDANLRMLR